jgi:flagellar basal-body rod protein FlgB
MLTKLDQYLHFHETALNLRAQRQEILSSNIANADTPNYKARDIDFNQVLKDRLSQTLSPSTLALNKTNEAHLTSSVPSADMPLLYRPDRQASADGNTVDMDIERNRFTENTLRYEVSVNLVSGQIKNMLATLQG